MQREKAARLKELSVMQPPQLPERVPVSNKSQEYLRMHRKKQEEKERQLRLTITRGKNEQEYECLLRIGEANEMLSALGNGQ